MSKKRKTEQRRTPNDFFLELLELEIASGYDGLWRGNPEPAIVIGVYGGAPRTLLRALFRLHIAAARFPQTIRVQHDELSVRGELSESDGNLVVIAVALEEDNGDGVQRIYGALERAAQLSLSALVGHDADPQSLTEIIAKPDAWRQARRSIVLVDGVPLSHGLVGDKWVAVAALCVARNNGTRKHRVHLVSEDRRNDWTAIIATKVGWRA